MIVYGALLQSPPDDADALSSYLQSLTLGVAHACRTSLQRLWVPELGAIHSVQPVWPAPKS